MLFRSKTGYKGRVGVHEILPVNLELSASIAKIASTEELLRVAKEVGFRSIQADALTRVAAGVTSFEEAKRVVAFSSVGLEIEKLAA